MRVGNGQLARYFMASRAVERTKTALTKWSLEFLNN